MEQFDFCMQFDNDEIHVIAAAENAEGCMEIKITTEMNGGVMLQDPTTGKKVRLFARPITDAGRAILEAEKPEE